MPSASHSSIRRTKRASGKSSLICASAAQMTQRWFGVWTPPAAIPSPAFTRNGRSEAVISGAPCRRRDRRRRRDVVHDESGIGRRVEVGGEQIDVALRALRALEKPGGEADALEQHAVAMESRSRVDEGRRQRLGDAACRSRPNAGRTDRARCPATGSPRSVICVCSSDWTAASLRSTAVATSASGDWPASTSRPGQPTRARRARLSPNAPPEASKPSASRRV